MPKIAYIQKRFIKANMRIIAHANEIITDMASQGFSLTLRQLYYQFIAKDLFPESWIDRAYNLKHGLDPNTKNTDKSYDKLGSIINDARMAGLIDWDAIEDRTRFVRRLAHWDTAADIVSTCAEQFRVDLWEGQPYRPEIWIEKDALVGVFERVANQYDTPLLSCRGYTSQSEMWGAAQRMLGYQQDGQIPVVFHFGDHDPSGIDMSRDITDRLELFTYGKLKFHRLALTMDQVTEFDPPPNPAKTSDSRFASYVAEYGDESWELDALVPTTLAGLVTDNLKELIDQDQWDIQQQKIDDGRAHLKRVSQKWDKIERWINSGKL